MNIYGLILIGGIHIYDQLIDSKCSLLNPQKLPVTAILNEQSVHLSCFVGGVR